MTELLEAVYRIFYKGLKENRTLTEGTRSFIMRTLDKAIIEADGEIQVEELKNELG